MKIASSMFSSADKASIADAIAAAEKLTSAEIVPVVATVSGRYDRAEDVVGVLFALVALCSAWIIFQQPNATTWAWIGPTSLGLPAVVTVVLLGFLLGATLATHIPALRLPFISREEMLAEVERRALETFQRQRIRDTARGTGVLIYVSLYEHLIKVITDDGVSSSLGQDALDEICALIVSGLQRNQPTDGLKAAIAKAGELLARELPGTVDNPNELGNELILLD